MAVQRRSEEKSLSLRDQIFLIGYSEELIPLVVIGAAAVFAVLFLTYYHDFEALR